MSDATAKPPAPDEEQPKLRPANENPWYLLATLHGEQKGKDVWDTDDDTHVRNRLGWNRYMATIAAPDVLERAKALKNADGSPCIPPEDLQPLDKKELADLKKRFRVRGGDAWPEGEVDFNSTSFTSVVCFDSFWFWQNASFEDAIFSGDAGFEDAIFSGDAGFDGATFSGKASFDSVTFSGKASFDSVTFSFIASFLCAAFSVNAYFDKITISNMAGFIGATFSGDATFENAKLQSRTSFAFAKFLESPPRFHGASLHEGTEWHGVTWPPAPGDREEAQQHVYNYERLKQEMERLKKHEDELKFFALEMRAKRVVDGKWKAAGLLNWVYDGLSVYGQSVARPFWLLGLSMLLGVVIENTPKTTGALPSTAEAYGLSLANNFAILPFVKDAVSRTELSALMNVVGVLQGGIGALMLFLIGLALRNRFRMK